MKAIVYRTPNCQKCRITIRKMEFPYEIKRATQDEIEHFRDLGYRSFPVVQIMMNGQVKDSWCDLQPGMINKWNAIYKTGENDSGVE